MKRTVIGEDGGELPVREPWVLREYFDGEGGNPLQTDDAGCGRFPIGDGVTIDARGHMLITDPPRT